jgi:hypothetical protein
MCSYEIDLVSSHFSRSSHKYLIMIYRQRRVRNEEVLKIHSGGLMSPLAFNVKVPYNTQFLFELFMSTAGEDENLELPTRGPAPSHLSPVYGKAPYYSSDPSTSSTSGGTCSGLNTYARPYYLSSMTSQGYPIGTPIFQPSAGTSSSSSSGASLDQDSIEDYPEIVGSVCWNPAVETRRINMVGPVRAASHNSSSRYPTIRGSEASDTRTPSNRIVQNLNLDFNSVRFQTIMESLQLMVQ